MKIIKPYCAEDVHSRRSSDWDVIGWFWLVKTARIIFYNQLLLTKFEKNFVILNQWRQRCSQLQINYWADDVKMTLELSASRCK